MKFFERRYTTILLTALLLLAMLPVGVSSGSYSQSSSQSSWLGIGEWTEASIPNLQSNTAVYAVRRNGNLVLVGTREQGLFRSANGGVSWQQVSQYSSAYFRDLWLASNSQTALAAVWAVGLLRTVDGGTGWNGTAGNSGTTLFLSVTGSSDQVVYAGSADNGVWKSTNAGNTWQATGSFPSPGAISLAATGNTVYAGSMDNGLFKSTNGGGSWQSSDFSGKLVRAIAIDPAATARLVVSVWDDGLYMSDNSGSSWTRRSAGLEGVNVFSLLVLHDPLAGRQVLAGTMGQGVYRWDEGAGRWVTWGLVGQNVYSLALWGDTVYAGTDGALGVYTYPPTPPAVTLRLFNDPIGAIEPGGKITYTIEYSTSSLGVTNVYIYNPIPAHVAVVENSIVGPGSLGSDRVTWYFPTLVANTRGEVRYQVQRPAAPVTPVIIYNSGAEAIWQGSANPGSISNAVYNAHKRWLPVITRCQPNASCP